MRPFVALLAALLLLAGCGEKDEPSSAIAGSSGSESGGEKRTLGGCLELWEGPHVGSTRLQNVAKSQTIYAKIEVKKGRCQVQFASRDGKVYGRYIEKENITGPWTMDAQLAPVAVAKRVFETANATGHEDGTLTPGTY